MRSARLTTRTFSLATAGLMLAVAVASVPAPARAADDNVPLDTRILRNVMKGLGLQDPNEAGITYEERAPLVIPPDKDLPPPQKSGAAIANNPAWPKDPDIARAKADAVRDRNYGTTEQIEREQNPLRPGQLEPKRQAKRTIQGPDNSRPTDYGYDHVMSPSELGYKGTLFGTLFAKDKPEVSKFTGEPARTSLTDPPPGYQVPSPDQPYGVGKETTAPKAEDSYITRGEAKY